MRERNEKREKSGLVISMDGQHNRVALMKEEDVIGRNKTQPGLTTFRANKYGEFLTQKRAQVRKIAREIVREIVTFLKGAGGCSFTESWRERALIPNPPPHLPLPHVQHL